MSGDVHEIDGVAVDLHQARVSGAFDVEETDASLMQLDAAEGMIVIKFRSKGATVTELASGAIKRTNVLKVVQAALVRDPVLQKMLAEALGLVDEEFPALAPGALTEHQRKHETRQETVKAELHQRTQPPAGALVQRNALEDDEPPTPTFRMHPIQEEPSLPTAESGGLRGAAARDDALASFLDGGS